MPVKVRCPSCDKLLNAPDGARGKAIKCPGCETKIRVPDVDAGAMTGKAQVGAKATKKGVGQDSMELLANIDLSKAVDSSASMCPKCGADIPEDATECPKCGIDPTTGQMTEAAKKRLARKGGIDPGKFYSVVWKDSWAFATENKKIIFRTITYAVIAYGIVGGCGFMVLWSSRLPPKTFWAGFGVVALQIFPGWVWHLRTETVRLTISKKRILSDVHFDLFQCVALGIKTILWSALFCWMPGTFLIFPLAMIHMSMPVTTRGWSWPSMLGTFFRNFAPTLYYWVINFVMDLPLYIAGGIVAGLFGREVLAMVQTIEEGGQPTVRVPFIVVASVVGVLSLIWFAFASLFMMRVTGLIAYYFRDTLDLVTRIPEKEYVHKEIKLDAFGVPLRSRGERIGQMMIPIVALIVIGFVGWTIYHQLTAPPGGSQIDVPPPGEAAPPAGGANGAMRVVVPSYGNVV